MRPALLLLLPLLGGCLLGPAPRDGAIATYDAVWEDFDQHYGLFAVKADDVDWDALGEDCRALLPADDTDEDALLDALKCLLGPLRDDHVRILRPDVEDGHWSAGRLEDLEITDFSEEVSGAWLLDPMDRGEARWGWLDPALTGAEDLDLAYLHLRTISPSSAVDAVDQAMAELSSADGLVLDLRENGGGYASVLEPIASHFADHDYVYAQIRRREGEGRTTYGAWQEWDVEAGEAPYLGPVALVTHAFSVSGAEHLALALTELDRVIHVGSPTAGAFSAATFRDAPNGWLYSISLEDVRDARGTSHEAVGVVPEILAESRLEETQQGVDRGMEAAVDALIQQLGEDGG